MRFFNKMKKTVLVMMASLFCAGVAFAEVKTGSYAVVADDIASGAQITSVEGITMTFGTSETWASGSGKVSVDGAAFNVYASTSENCSPSNGAIPTAGPYVVFTPQFNGTVTGIVSNAGETKKGYIVKDEDNNLVNGTVLIDGAEVAWESGTPYNSATKYNGGVTFEVEAGSTYYFYMAGSKMRFNGFIYTYEEVEAEPETPATEEVQLTADIFKAWDGVSADAQATGAANCELHVGEELGAGSIIYGTSTVYYLNYADLSAYSKMVFEGTPGVQLCVLMNRMEDQSAFIEKNLVIGDDGKGEVDFSDMEFVHLNAIKTGWGSAAGTITKIVLVKTASSTIESQGIIYTKSETKDSYTATSYTADLPTDVVFPSELDGLPVTTIAANAFADAATMKSIILPASVNIVGDKAFSGCHSLLVVEWNAAAPLLATCFDAAEAYGNMLVFTSNADANFAGNVVVNGQAEKITLSDGRPFRNPKEFTAKHISYSREFTKKTKAGMAGGWEGIVLPFDVQTISHEEKGLLSPFGAETEGLPCWIAEWQPSNKTFVLSHSNLPNQPFIMEVPNSEEYDDRYNIEGRVTFAAENVTVHATTGMTPITGNGYSLQGTYEGVTATDNVYALNDDAYTTGSEYFLPGGVFVANARDIRPFEAYIHNSQLTRSRYLPVQGGKAQGMDNLLLKGRADEKDDAWYTLQGIRLNGKPMQKGMYIHGGKRVIVR